MVDFAASTNRLLYEGRQFSLSRAEGENDASVLLKTTVAEFTDPEAREQLRREYELAANLDHPNLARAIDFVVAGTRPVLVLSDDGGTPLRTVLDDGALSLRRSLEVAIGVASGLAELHGKDIVHRDLRPEGITVSDGGAVRIVDLGQASVLPRQQATLITPSLVRESLAYIAPEQTGRTSRPVDYRADLYALGITLFEMLVGEVPFTSDEPLDLVHEHLAVRPANVCDRRPELPRVVGSLVAHLLEKDPGDRYRSALGVVRDLRQILDRIVRGLDPDTLELDGATVSTRFQLPDKLFGREEEVAELTAWFERSAVGQASLFMIHGYSGIGKSSLIEELRAPINRRRGYLAQGKFDQLDQGSAYRAVLAVFRDLVRQLLTEDETRLAAWRRQLLDALGDGAGALVEVVPNLRALLGDVPASEPLEAGNARNRFNRLVSLFLATVATPTRPLVILLDDLQWADSATLEFVERITLDTRDSALLLIGAYRDNEVDETHPVQLMRRRLAAAGVAYGDLALEPLSDEAMAELVATSLGRPVSDAAPLIDLCIRRTGSNPFFVRIFLRSLFEDGLLQLDASSGAWSWDMEQVAARKLTDNMVELAMDKIAGASEGAQRLLSAMSIVGIESDAALLREIQPEDPTRELYELAAQELILLSEGHGSVRWQFAHDRIQEAASVRLSAEQRLDWHRRIGAVLRRRLQDGKPGSNLFSVLRHLNEVARAEGGQDLELAALNLEGGRAAMRATAYEAASKYFSTGISQLGPEPWATDTELTFALHLGAADAARLATQFVEMDHWLHIIQQSAVALEHRVQAALLQMLYLGNAGDNEQAVEVARGVLAELGWKLPARPGVARVVAGMMKTRLALRKHSAEELARLPEMTDARSRSILRILGESVASAYFVAPNVMGLMIQKAVQLSVRQGNDPASAFFYSAFGMVLSGILGQPEAGLRYANLAVELAERFGAEAKPGRVRFLRDTLVAPATTPLREIEAKLEKAYAVSTETGDLGFSTGALFFRSLHRMLYGMPLDSLEPDLEATEALLRRHVQVRNLNAALALRQFVHDVRHGATDGVPFTGPHVDGDRHLAGADRMTACWTHAFRGIVRFHRGDIEGAYRDIVASDEYLDGVLGQALVPLIHLYGVLIGTEAAESGDRGARRFASRHRKRLAWHARYNPADHAASLLLADGALAAAGGKQAEALELLDGAANGASEKAIPLVAALAWSVSAVACRRAGNEAGANRRAQNARDAFRSWGATALAGGRDAQDEAAAPTASFEGTLDLEAVIRASEAISEEIEVNALLGRLLRVTLQNAGADRAVLLRVVGDLVLPEAEGRLEPGASEASVHTIEPGSEADVSETVIRLVARTGEPVISRRAVSDPLLGSDASIQKREVRSLLCLPLVNQGRMQGILYMENNQVDGAFTPARYRLLRILSSQAASALEKARLLQAQDKLIEAQNKFVPAQFLRTLGRPNLLDVELGHGALREADILFTDIRGFTGIVEEMSPGEAMRFLNGYLGHMEPIIHEYGGFIERYDGDAILALFDADADDTGVRAAIAMAAAEHEDNRRRAQAGLPPVRSGFGLNTGSVMLGIVGGPTSMRASLIGDAVNLASRVENLTKRYTTPMLISENTAQRLNPSSNVRIRPLERVQVAGKHTNTLVYEVLNALDPSTLDRRLASLDDYLDAHNAYENGDWERSRAALAAIAAADPDDAPVRVMLARCEQLLASGEAYRGPPVTRLEKG